MPITMAQVGLFALASFAVNDHGNGALLAALFPLSSPFAMLARAALDPAILPHLAALAWQALWVSLILKGAAAWFRRAVLNGPGEKKRWWKRSPASAA
jgi:ABC-2 type transport system permease protein